MPKELNEETKAALAAQGGITDEGTQKVVPEETGDKGGLPAIVLDGQSDEQLDAKAKEEAEAARQKATDLDIKVNKTLEGAGYDEAALKARLTKDGGISDEFVTELKGKIDPDFVDAHVGRLRAELELAKVKESGRIDEIKAKEQVTKTMNDYIYKSVGGEDKFKILGKALKSELSSDELASINVRLASGNEGVVQEALKFAVKKYNDIRGMGGKLMEGDAGNGVDAPEHVTKEEYRAQMRTDKYKTDPAYARKVDADRLKTREQDSIRYGAGQYFGFHPDKGRYPL